MVTIDVATGRKIVKGGVLDLGGDHGAAVYLIRGQAGAEFTITIPHTIELAGTSGAVLTDFTVLPAGGGVIGPGGQATVRMGATLQLRPNQPTGQFEAPFSISVAYRD